MSTRNMPLPSITTGDLMEHLQQRAQTTKPNCFSWSQQLFFANSHIPSMFPRLTHDQKAHRGPPHEQNQNVPRGRPLQQPNHDPVISLLAERLKLLKLVEVVPRLLWTHGLWQAPKPLKEMWLHLVSLSYFTADLHVCMSMTYIYIHIHVYVYTCT